MGSKDIAQLLVSAIAPLIAAAGALGVARLSFRERVSIAITWGTDYRSQDVSFIAIHNRSSQAVAITTVRYVSGVFWRTAEDGTALDYEDPSDLAFPYLIEPGKILRLRLNEYAAKRLAKESSRTQTVMAWALRRSRFLVECRSTAGSRYRTSGEPILSWDDQLPWKRGG